MVTHSKDSALSPREYELLLEGARRIDKPEQRLDAEFAILVTGRLGLRAGELTHMTEDWLDWRSRRITIPRQQDCHLGRGDEPCGHCLQSARQMVRIYQDGDPDDMSRARERFFNKHIDGGFEAGDALTLEDVKNLRWFAKTDAANREVPFGHNARAELIIERFFDENDGWNMSQSALQRRLNKALRLADELDESTTMPHGLRSTTATHLASQNVDPLTLKSVMGWESFDTAKCYISESADRAERALQRTGSI